MTMTFAERRMAELRLLIEEQRTYPENVIRPDGSINFAMVNPGDVREATMRAIGSILQDYVTAEYGELPR
jgi:hypothetical protein